MAIGSTNSIGGAAQGASAGMAFGPWGAVIGGAIGAISGAGADSAERGVYRANRRQEQRNNAALVQQASRTAEAGARMTSTQAAGYGAAGVQGASQAATQFDTMYQTYRDQLAILAGVTDDFQGRAPLSLGQQVGRELERAWDSVASEYERVGRRIGNELERAWDRVESWF